MKSSLLALIALLLVPLSAAAQTRPLSPSNPLFFPIVNTGGEYVDVAAALGALPGSPIALETEARLRYTVSDRSGESLAQFDVVAPVGGLAVVRFHTVPTSTGHVELHAQNAPIATLDSVDGAAYFRLTIRVAPVGQDPITEQPIVLSGRTAMNVTIGTHDAERGTTTSQYGDFFGLDDLWTEHPTR